MEGNWLLQKINEVHSTKDKSTAVLILNTQEFWSIAATVAGPMALGDDFIADLKLKGSWWFYHASSGKRCLVIIHKSKEDATQDQLKKVMRDLGKEAAALLSSKKIIEADFIFGSQTDGLSQTAGQFLNSFDNANYEKSFKRAPQEELKAGDDPRSQRSTNNVESVSYHYEDASIQTSEEYLFQIAAAHAKSTSKALARERGSVATPTWMTEQAKKIAAGCPLIKEVRVLTGKELEKEGMNLFYNVGKGAVSQPSGVFIHYQGRPEDAGTVDLGIVGKGVTYDTGGLNIKTAMIELMYGDKGGSCAVLGALKGCIELKLKKNIIFSCAFAENAIGSEAYKPSDILTAMNGLTVEVANTDAEGRLVMADTMTYVQRNFKPKKVTYIATLTGACAVALGKTTGGLFATDKEMVTGWKNAAADASEPMWPMPIADEHRESTVGKFGADLSNMGDCRWGGACHAAAFLEKFIEDERPWAHLDIAGPAIFGEKDASGFGAKLLLSYIHKQI